MEGLYDFNKLLWTANLPEHLPETLSVYRIRSLGEINEDHDFVLCIFPVSASLRRSCLGVPCPARKATLALGDDVAYADVIIEAIEQHTSKNLSSRRE